MTICRLYSVWGVKGFVFSSVCAFKYYLYTDMAEEFFTEARNIKDFFTASNSK